MLGTRYTHDICTHMQAKHQFTEKKIVNLKKIRNVSNFRKIKKIQVSQAWWHTPMILALKDTEAGRSL